MNTIENTEVTAGENFFGYYRLKRRLIEKTLPVLEKEYGLDTKAKGEVDIILDSQLDYLLPLTEGNLNKKFIDLGCGSNSRNRVREPWLCRFLYHSGFSPIGVDLGNLKHEKFTSYSKNLTEADSLREIPGGSIDIANASLLFNCDYLLVQMGEDPGKLKQNLSVQLERILKPEGIFVYREDSVREGSNLCS